jgi:hypothetical protein
MMHYKDASVNKIMENAGYETILLFKIDTISDTVLSTVLIFIDFTFFDSFMA